MLILIKTTEDKNTQELEYTQEEHADSNLSIDPDFSSEGIISTEKKSLAIAQFQIAKHEQILQKREEEKAKKILWDQPGFELASAFDHGFHAEMAIHSAL